MGLKGNLRDFSITQLLNLVNLAHKSGTLVVERTNEKMWVCFREGKLAYAQSAGEDASLATVLYKAKKLSAAQHSAIKARAGAMSDKELGLLLINASYLTQEDILASLQAYFLQTMNRLLTWAEGLFRFESDLLPPDDKITVRLSLENIIIEGARRMKELEQLQDEIPSLDIALKFADRPGANIRNVNLSVDEWQVVRYISPKNSLRQIARATNKNDLEIRRIVYALLQAGLVEFVRPAGALPSRYPNVSQSRTPSAAPSTPQAQTRQAAPPKDKAEQKSLINRLISRIRSL
jgi:hypothetical protein